MLENSSNVSKAPAHSPRIVSIARSVALGTSIAIIVLLILVITKPGKAPDNSIETDNSAIGPDEPGPENPDSDANGSEVTEKVPDFINLQPTIDLWQKATSADVGLMVYDLDNQRIAASYQANKVFNIASIYKLFFVYAGYRQIESGALDPNVYFVTTNDYRAGNYNLGECLDLMIRESYNGCADPIRANSSFATRAEAIVEELGLENTSNLGLYSTAADLTRLLKLYYYHPDLSENSWDRIADSMLNQPSTKVAENVIYNWRQGLPTGFSDTVNVYDKVGWEWDGERWKVYADAAIVEFPELNRHYTVV